MLSEFALPANVIVGPKPNECVVYESESISSKCDKCDYTNTDKNSVDEHISLTHEFVCTECDTKFDEKCVLEQHNLDVHDKRGIKRHRFDTSLVFDSQN